MKFLYLESEGFCLNRDMDLLQNGEMSTQGKSIEDLQK